jgi:hypothetical protein
MNVITSFTLTTLIVSLLTTPIFSQTVEPLYSGTFTRIKSPGPGMSFTEGLPIRVVADGVDINGYQWLEGSMEAEKVEFYVDGVLHDTDNYLRGYNHFETVLYGLSVGVHSLTTKSYNYGGVVETSPFPVTIIIDPVPVKPNTIHLSADIYLTGSTDLSWQNAVVYGHGYRVTSSPGWTGDILIQNSFITGLATTVDSVPTVINASNPGIDVVTTGSVTIENSVFEWTGANYFEVNGSGSVTVRKNEFRASAFIPYESSYPDLSPVIQFEGSSTNTKVFQTNNVGAGYLNIYYMNNWLIGGNNDSLSNIFIGPRTGVRIESSSNVTIQGNYSRHDYYGGWSQGYNFRFYGNNPPFLCEHNVIRQGSWPVQNITGIFRYNLVVVAGHEWIRNLEDNTEVYRNVFINPEPAGYPQAGCWMYDDEINIKFYNNTFDGGGLNLDFESAAIAVSDGSEISMLRNNLFTNFIPDASTGIVDRYPGDTDNNARITYADYNAFYNPDAGGANNYGDNLVNGITEGNPGFGGHDLGGLNGQVDPQLNQGMSVPYQIEEDKVWNRIIQVSCILADFRDRYTPQGTSPLVDAGDPAGGTGVDIGAIESPAGMSQANDLFGIFGCTSLGIENPSTGKLKLEMITKPNPFNISTEISYMLPAILPVSISIYNMEGKMIVQLLKNEMQDAGIHSMIWKTQGIIPGIYLIKLNAENYTESLRVVFVE